MIIGLLAILSIISTISIKQNSDDIHESEIVLSENAESIVSLEDTTSRESGRGTGFVVTTKSGKQVIVTNAHVCDMNKGKPVFAVGHRKGSKLREYSRLFVKPIKFYDMHDLCIVEVPKDIKFKSLKLADKVLVDSKVTIVGYPVVTLLSSSSGHYRGLYPVSLPYDLEPQRCIGTKYSVQTVPIKQKDGTKIDKQICFMSAVFMFTDALGDHGQSGSPALNKDGEVVGVMSLVNGQARPFASLVPLTYLKAFLSKH